MSQTKILLVDDDAVLLATLASVLREEGFETTTAGTVPEALKYISSRSYDVLLSDLHMPGKGDGLTVVSAMRHANPKAVTMLLSAFPEMDAAAQAILMQADLVLVKPMNMPALIETIKQRLTIGAPESRKIESVATILEFSIRSTIDAWLDRVEQIPNLRAIRLTREQRAGHLPKLLLDLVKRLRTFQQLGSKELRSVAAEDHGRLRKQQGYTASMIVEESRELQVSIFETLRKNLENIDFSMLLTDVMTIADEVDSQLGQQMDAYIEEAVREKVPA